MVQPPMVTPPGAAAAPVQPPVRPTTTAPAPPSAAPAQPPARPATTAPAPPASAPSAPQAPGQEPTSFDSFKAEQERLLRDMTRQQHAMLLQADKVLVGDIRQAEGRLRAAKPRGSS
ncbi:hypothetical protein JY651_43550 [Pyxidicoccus parkwayensis]|uniref:Uncharacterized protein n=1 Tax=Pyxidicoccus parkwayensis TaxID=2813578 RepID=A0ABX7NT43_9BACT|nr:hypothetical protein [Pyxidicoccus parkwaysis]QSQ21950.1 hypothetical protein JY651_43550 [Pyxidicoccus parkwaysis]